MELFPYALLRIGGDSFALQNSLRLEKSIALSREYLRLKKHQEQVKISLCEDLLEFIQHLENSSDQNLLQNLRRDIFNNRRVKAKSLSRAFEIIRQAGLLTRLQNYHTAEEQIRQLPEQGNLIYQVELEQKRAALKPLIQSPPLLNGLILSSNSLLERVPSYLSRSPSQIRKRETQVEQSLIKYLTRIYSKTSPFSTFTNLAAVKYAQHPKSIFQIGHKNQKNLVTSHIRLNNHLFKYLMDLLRNYRSACLLLPLRPNPTISRDGDHYSFLTNFSNVESFQRIPFSPVIELVRSLSVSHKKGIPFHQLIKTLKEEISASEADIETYIKQLVDSGFVEYNLGVSGMDADWDLHLIKALKPLAQNRIDGISMLQKVLASAREKAKIYATAHYFERKVVLQQAFTEFKTCFYKIHEAAGLPAEERITASEQASSPMAKGEKKVQKTKDEFSHQTSTRFHFKAEQIFYEDSIRELDATLNKQSVHDLTAKLDRLLKETAVFKLQEQEKLKMADYFLKKYAPDSEIDLLLFYEDYFRDFKWPEREFLSRYRAAVSKDDALPHNTNHWLKVDAITKRANLLSKWNGLLSELVRNDLLKDVGEINLTAGYLAQVNKELKIPRNDSKPEFHGAFQQLYLEDGTDGRTPHLKMVLNGTFMGYGKMISRFLHILDKDVLNKTRAYNTSLIKKGVLFIEDTDASFFNVNLHPPVLPYEIWMPGGNNSVQEENQLAITDFCIRYDGVTEQLQLIHKPTKQRSFIFNIGFQGSKGRSELFQLLEVFSVTDNYYPQFVNKAINSIIDTETSEENGLKVYPRITFEQDIMLQRKTWQMTKILIPVKEKNEKDWDYLTRILVWQEQYKIPDEVFVIINPAREKGANTGDKTNKLTRDDYKPQYVDFRNPFLLSLFSKLIDKAPDTVKIQEMLPGSEQLLKVDGKPFVSEYVVQWIS